MSSSSRESDNSHHHRNHSLSIDTAQANTVHNNTQSNRQALPSPLSSSSRSSSSSQLPCPPPEGMISTATLSHPPTLAIPSVPYPPPTNPSHGYYFQQQHSQQQHIQLRHRSLSGSGTREGTGALTPPRGTAGSTEEEENMARMAMANMNRRPSLPANHPYHHPMERQPSHDPRRQQQILQLQQQHQGSYFRQQHNSSRSSLPQDQMPLTPNTPGSSAPSGPVPAQLSSSTNSNHAGAPPPQVVRHPLWRLDCQSCKTTLCEQAMQGHLVGDPSKKLFSTNLAIGVLGLPDRPVSIICPCKFHLFACASCGSVCGYNLSQPCTGCETNRGNGHFWIFYAHEITAHWRTTPEDGRQMFWDDLPTWCHASDGNVGR